MKQVKLFGMALIAILSLAGLIAAASNAATLPSMLPEAGPGAEHILVAFTSAESKLGGSFEGVKSKKDEGTLEINSLKLGLFDILFLETKDAIGTTCTGLNDTTAGSVLALGTFHIRDYTTSGGALLTAADILLIPVHFSCGGTLVVVSGCVLGAMSPENTKLKGGGLSIKFEKASGKEDNALITVLNEGNTASENCELLSENSINTTTKLVFEETTEGLLPAFRNGTGTEIEIEVMRL